MESENATFRTANMIHGNFSRLQPVPSPRLVSELMLKAWFGIALAISFAGSLMIILLLTVFGLNRQLRTGAAVLICHLLLLGLLMSAVLLPVNTIATYAMQTNTTVAINCAALQFLQITTANTENWSAVFLAINRFVATLFPTHYTSFATKNVLAGMILISWVIGLANNVPLYLNGSFGKILFKGCGVKLEGPKAMIFTAVGNYVPLGLILVLYLVVMFKMLFGFLRQRIFPTQGNCGQRPALEKTVRRRLAVARMLFVSALFHCGCFLPVPMLLIFYPSLYFGDLVLQQWLRLLPICGYAANPVIFLVLNKDYQAGLKNYLGGKRKVGHVIQTAVTAVNDKPVAAPKK